MKKRIVIKIGSSLLTNGGVGIDEAFIRSICNQVVELMDEGHQVVLVSSGAVASDPIPAKKAGVEVVPRSNGLRAAVGQPKLMNCYRTYFNLHGLEIAQFLVNDYLLQDANNRYTRDLIVEALDDCNIVPIINGHDTANDAELKMLEKCADNDTLCWMIAELIDATDVIIAFDQDGVINTNGYIIHVAKLKDREYIMSLAQESKNTVGHGCNGMSVKLHYLFRLADFGRRATLAPGKQKKFILRAIAGEKKFGTIFVR